MEQPPLFCTSEDTWIRCELLHLQLRALRRTETDSPWAAEMLLENFWPSRELELRGSLVSLREEEPLGEVLTPEVLCSTVPGRRVPKRADTPPTARRGSSGKGPVSSFSFVSFHSHVIIPYLTEDVTVQKHVAVCVSELTAIAAVEWMSLTNYLTN